MSDSDLSVVDPYVNPQTGVLHNLIGAETSEDLATAEADLHYVRALQIHENDLVPHTRDLEEFKQLHRHLFQDLFSWAGETRIIDMKRGDGKFFAPCVLSSSTLNTLSQRFAKKSVCAISRGATS